MRDSVLIDLGEVRGEPAASVVAAGGARHRLVAAVAGVALAAVLGGSAAVPPGLIEIRVPGVVGGSIQVDDDRLYVFDPSRVGDDTRTVTAYRLPDGRRLWRARVAGGGRDYSGMVRLGDVLVVARHGDGVVRPRIAAVDAGTGRQRWQRSGELLGSGRDAAGRTLLVFGNGRSQPGAVGLVSAVDAGTGRVAWTYRARSGSSSTASWLPYGGPNRLVTGLPSGRVELRDIATGGVLAAVNARSTVAPEARDQRWVTIAGDLVLVVHHDGRTISAYGLDRLEHRWTGRWPNGLGPYADVACGPLLCFAAPEGGLRAVDPRTGGLRWHATWTYVRPVGSMLLVSADSTEPGEPMRLQWADPATGRAVRHIGTWAAAPGQDDPVLYRQDAHGRAWLAVLDPSTGDVRLLGMARDVVGDCRSGRHSVVCPRRDADIGIWRYR